MKQMILSLFALCLILSACKDDSSSSRSATSHQSESHDSRPLPGGESPSSPQPETPRPPRSTESGICNSHGQCASKDNIANMRTLAQAELLKFKNKPANEEEEQFRKSFVLSRVYKYLTGFEVTDEDSKFLGDLYRAVYEGEGQ